MMNKMKDIYPDGPITSGDKKLMEMEKMNEMKETVRDRMEDLYWTLAPHLTESSKDELDQLMCNFRVITNEIIDKD